MVKNLNKIVNEEIKKMVEESIAPYSVIESGIRVFWKYNRHWFDRVLEGTAYGVLTGKYTPQKSYVKLTTAGPDGKVPGQIIRVSTSKLMTVDGKKPLITPEEYEKKINMARESNIY